MRRFRIIATTTVLAGLGGSLLSGCGVAGRDPGAAAQPRTAVEVAAAMGAEGQALAAMGIATEEIALIEQAPDADSDPAADESADDGSVTARELRKERRERRHARVLLRRNALHGEAVVQTEDGTKTVAAQRGEVTAIDADSMTVKSTDGFTMNWSFGSDLRVIERRSQVQPTDVEVGTVVGVAGAKDGDAGVARLIVIPRPR